MTWGMTTSMFTFLHVLISLTSIGTGAAVMSDLLTARERKAWTAAFLATTVAASVTGFGFPLDHLLPSHMVAIISLLVLGLAIVARHRGRLRGAWRSIYAVAVGIALYLNVFVAVAQAFAKAPVLNTLAREQAEPFLVGTQLAVLMLFMVLTVRALEALASESPDDDLDDGSALGSFSIR